MPRMIPVGEWLPDLPPYQNPGALTATNVLPAINSYESFPAVEPLSDALGSRCLGAILARDSAANSYFYAGDQSALYSLDQNVFSDVSGIAYAVPDDFNWEFVQWGQTVIAVNGPGGNDPQSISLGGVAFANLSGGPPRAAHIGVIGDFVVLGHTLTSPQQVRWSAINNATSWTADAATLADFQEVPGDGGWIQRIISGGQYGVIFQERAIFRMAFVGAPLVFRIDQIHQGIGALAPNGVVAYRNWVFFLSREGFMLFDGNDVNPIGQNKVDRFFLNDLDSTRRLEVWASIDPSRKIVAWLYPSTGGDSGHSDRIIVYHWGSQRWALIDAVSLEVLVLFQSQGFTLDGLDAVSTDIDALPASLDSTIWAVGDINFGAFNSDHRLATFTGPTRNAVVETGEVSFNQYNRTLVTEIWPVVEGLSASVTVQPIVRNTFTQSASVGAAASINTFGYAPVLSTGRYHRFRINTVGDFDNIQGVQVHAVRGGMR